MDLETVFEAKKREKHEVGRTKGSAITKRR